jgi:phage gpG-like protein
MAGFRDLADRLAELEWIPSRIASEVAGAINESIADQFSAGHDPYGKPWAPLLPSTVRRKGGDRRILRRTDVLSSETVAKPTSGAGIEISSVDYGQFHQTGTKRMVARKILPDGAELPATWSKAIEEATERAFKKALK